MDYLSSLTKQNRIGGGAFGEVFLCNDDTHGPVAAKFFYSANFKSERDWIKACSRALSEAQSMKALEHRNVVRVFQVLRSPQDDEFVIVMEYCSLKSIRSIAESDYINLVRIKEIVRDAGIGLSYIANKGYLHRDIKPDNILLSQTGEVKIGDFGFVTDKLVYGFAAAYGTPVYLAPEVIINEKCSAVSDVYSLGVTFLHMAHGDFWFLRQGEGAILGSGQYGDAVNANFLYLPHVPVQWRNVINRMMHANDKRRFQSMDAAVNAISKLPKVEDWTCTVTANSVNWSRIKGERRIRVEWINYLTAGDYWRAWSEGLDGANSRTLGRSGPGDTWKKNYRGLQSFFSSRSP